MRLAWTAPSRYGTVLTRPSNAGLIIIGYFRNRILLQHGFAISTNEMPPCLNVLLNILIVADDVYASTDRFASHDWTIIDLIDLNVSCDRVLNRRFPRSSRLELVFSSLSLLPAYMYIQTTWLCTGIAFVKDGHGTLRFANKAAYEDASI